MNTWCLTASNTKVHLFHTGFLACDTYAGGEAAMQKVEAPVLFVLGRGDQMTPPKAAQPLVRAATNAKVVLVDGGHQMMLEAPDAVLFAIRDFLGA